MTVPKEYRQASAQFDDFLAEVADATGLSTRHQAFTTLQGVLFAFRRRLSLLDAIHFLQILPPMLKALFVSDWDPNQQPAYPEGRREWSREVQELRVNHNISPASAVEDVAAVLRRHVDHRAFEACLKKLPEFAKDFWAPRKRHQ